MANGNTLLPSYEAQVTSERGVTQFNVILVFETKSNLNLIDSLIDIIFYDMTCTI